MRTLNMVRDDYIAVIQFPVIPDKQKFHYYHDDEVIDEYKSVHWNHEEIKKRNKQYQDEVARLRQTRADKIKEIKSEIYEIIVNEVGNGLTIDKAKIIFNKAYEDKHSYGIYEVFSCIDEYIDFISDILK